MDVAYLKWIHSKFGQVAARPRKRCIVDKEVVVKTVLSIEERGDGEVFAARLKELGLTAYGRTPSEAKSKVKGRFHAFIAECRKRGVLEARLDRVGVEWGWRGEYAPPEGVEVEETAPGAERAEAPADMEFRPMTSTTAMAA